MGVLGQLYGTNSAGGLLPCFLQLQSNITIIWKRLDKQIPSINNFIVVIIEALTSIGYSIDMVTGVMMVVIKMRLPNQMYDFSLEWVMFLCLFLLGVSQPFPCYMLTCRYSDFLVYIVIWAVLGRYFEKVIHYLLFITTTAMKSVIVTYYLVLKVSINK